MKCVISCADLGIIKDTSGIVGAEKKEDSGSGTYRNQRTTEQAKTFPKQTPSQFSSLFMIN